MSITVLAFGSLWAGLLHFLQQLKPSHTPPQGAFLKPLTSSTKPNSILERSNRPLRVIRWLERDQSPSQMGRMVISGSMADVCAELDRLVARETARH